MGWKAVLAKPGHGQHQGRDRPARGPAISVEQRQVGAVELGVQTALLSKIGLLRGLPVVMHKEQKVGVLGKLTPSRAQKLND